MVLDIIVVNKKRYEEKKIIFEIHMKFILTPNVPQRQFLADASLTAFFAHSPLFKISGPKKFIISKLRVFAYQG